MLETRKAGKRMKEGKGKLSVKVVAAMLEAIAIFLETTKDVSQTVDMIRKMQKRLSE